MFDVMVNPFGTIFNPLSIAKVVNLALNNIAVNEKDLHAIDNRYFHHDFHSTFASSTPEKVVLEINVAIKKVGHYMKTVDFIILTFGTSIVYKLKSTNAIVSNCHKVPNHNFEKETLTVEFMEEGTLAMLDLIKRINPDVKVILTVSPVRHTKEGLVENSLSKSRLIDLCHRLTEKINNTTYFPSFEIMIDQLRDYRFYKSDLIHPNESAVDIIWSYFMETYFHDLAMQKIQDINVLNSAMNHVPFDASSEGHQKFKQNQLKKIDHFKQLYPEVDFEEMTIFFKS